MQDNKTSVFQGFEKGRNDRYCLRHIPKKEIKEYGLGCATHNYKVKMNRVYKRSLTGKRGFIPIGFYCEKCNRFYFDSFVAKHLYRKKKFFSRC